MYSSSLLHAAVQWVSQFLVVVWKNMKLRLCSKISLITELIFPIFVVLLWVSFMAIMLDSDSVMKTQQVEDLHSHVGKDKILYAPNTISVNAVMAQLATDSLNTNLSSPSFMGFPSYELLHSYYRNHSTSVFAGLFFGYNNGTDSVFGSVTSYSISMDNSDLPSTDDIYGGGKGAVLSYVESGFLSLQVAVDMALLKVIGGAEAANSTIQVNQFPGHRTPLWKQWLRGSGLGQAGAAFFLIGFFTSIFRMMTDRVQEKETKIKELLRMGGLRMGTESAGWWVTVFLCTSGSIVSLVYILQALKIIHNSDLDLIFLFYFATIASLIALGQLISVFVNKAKFVGMLGLLVVLILGGVGIAIAVLEDKTPAGVKILLSLFSPTAFSIGNGIIFRLEDKGVGLTMSNYDSGEPSIRDLVGLIFLDTIIYSVLSWYLDLVMPGEYGTAQSPLFFLRIKYWFPSWKSSAYEPLLLRDASSMPSYVDGADVERVATNMRGKETVMLKDVRKEFTSNNIHKVAVDGLSFVLYEDHITALLGHNGAGKTTTISMLTGLIPPTSGDATIHGKSIGDEMSDIRSSLLLGVCPQANVLWDDFSVQDHLYIHAVLKGVGLMQLRATVNNMVRDLGLEEKRFTRSAALSGGQKRKLQLAIAFIGNSKVVFLDEPTSGMDPVTRRSVWDFLNKYKAGKTIVLTTHFMDEADILGDRIIVVSQGKVRCAGSSLFLKSRFGAGYLLTMVKSPSCEPHAIESLIKKHVPKASLLSEFGAELAYRLPGTDLSNFSKLFVEIDESQQQLGIASYGVSLTTLEEVFLRIGLDEKESEKKALDVVPTKNLEATQRALSRKPQHGHSFVQQVRALLLRRVQSAPRDRRAIMFAVILPLLFVAGAIAIGKTMSSTLHFPQYLNPLQMGLFPNSHFAVQEYPTELLAWSPPSYSFYTAPNVSMSEFLSKSSDYVAALSFTNNTNISQIALDYVVYFNNSLEHTVPSTLNMINDATLRYLTNGTQGINTTILPFEHILTSGEQNLSDVNPSTLALFALLMMGAFAMIPSGLVVHVVQERVLNIKRLLLVSGTSKLAYWVSSFIWDIFSFFLISLFVLILLACVKMDGFLGENWGVALLMFTLYSLASLSQSYFISLSFKSHASAMARLFAFHYILAFTFFNGYFSVIINAGISGGEGLDLAAKIVTLVFIGISPLFNFCYVLFTLKNFMAATPRNGGSFFQMGVLGWSCVSFISHAAFWWILLLIVEHRGSFKLTRLYKGNLYTDKEFVEEDEDVVSERQRVSVSNDDVIIVRGMRKEYPDGKSKKVAVANLSLGVPMGQCFGLLGMNGAGKSTALGVLSADIAPTKGEVYLNGYNLLTDPRDALRYFGWCPQFDALIDTLTGREQLALYARIKGMDESVIPDTVAAFLEVLDMEYLADRLAGGYSGGNKRKLSLAIAMIGNPPLVFLDEPSTGMDPLSKRLMWQVITQLGQDKAIIVTTHYMEECEALCSRIGIMSQGRLVCLGSSQHLKSRFATGYTIQIKAKPGNVTVVRDLVARKFPTAQLTDAHDDLLAFQLPETTANARIAPIFASLVEMGESADDFSVSQTTLEQVFLKLAKEKKTD